MFEIFKFKSKTIEEIPTESTDTTDQPEPIVDDFDLDLGDLESGPKRPKLKVSYKFIIHDITYL